MLGTYPRSILITLAAVAGCAEDIRPGELDAGLVPDAKVATVRHPDGTATTRVNASSSEAWTFLDLDTGAEAGEPEAWDLAAQRFHIKLNGGVSGPGGVEIATSPLALAALTEPPSEGWVSDADDGDDEGSDPDYAFEQGAGWYAYDGQTHVLTPRPITWVVRTTDDAAIALVIAGYYDDAGTSGYFTFHWKPLSPRGT